MITTLALVAAIAAPCIVGSLAWAGASYRPLQKAVATTAFVVSVATTFAFLGLEASGSLEQFVDQYRF